MTDQTKAADLEEVGCKCDLPEWLRLYAIQTLVGIERQHVSMAADLLESQATRVKELEAQAEELSRTAREWGDSFATTIKSHEDKIAELEAALTLTPERLTAASDAYLDSTADEEAAVTAEIGDSVATYYMRRALLAAGFQEPAKEQS